MTNKQSKQFILTITFSFTLFLLVLIWLTTESSWWIKHKIYVWFADYTDVTENITVNIINWRHLQLFLTGLLFLTIVIMPLMIVSLINIVQKKERERLNQLFTKRLIENETLESDILSIENTVLKIESVLLDKETALKNESKRTKDLVMYLAHDLKTPLASVIGYINLLLDTTDLTPEQREKFLQITLNKSERLELLINEFFDITRFNFQDISLYLDQIDFVFLLKQMMDEFYPMLQQKQQSFDYLGPESLIIQADGEKLARVINNLIKNAYSYGREKSVIKLEVQDTNQQLLFSVQNIGPTIPKEQLHLIFEKFYRMDQSRSTNNGGAGVGLAIAKEIVTAHKGELTAVSENHVTTFIMSIPKT